MCPILPGVNLLLFLFAYVLWNGKTIQEMNGLIEIRVEVYSGRAFIGPLTLKFDRATRPFLKIDR